MDVRVLLIVDVGSQSQLLTVL